MRQILMIALCFACTFVFAQNNISVHDPVIIKQNDRYYIFCTGRGISVWSSSDMKEWKKEKPVFETAPQWAVDSIPSFKNHIWAPDISFHNNQYCLFYAVSAFGKNTSCIGLATNATLDSSDSKYHWQDHGMVIQSVPGKSNFNAIDPNLFIDGSQAYLTFGSFWCGIQLVKLNKDLMKPVGEIKTIASRKKFPEGFIPNNGAGNAIEAPFIFKKNSDYYLFASIDYCCKGKDSNYKMIVGKSKNIEGPYIDKEGKLLTEGGGTILLQGDKDWYGVGHNAVATFDGIDYIVFHAYDANDNGKPKLRIEKLDWNKEGWPFIIQ